MAFDFNPITGQLDLVGGGSSYIDGDVEYHADLPVTVGTPAVNSAFLVRKGQGLYFLTRKPAGIWVRELNNGNLDDWKYAGTFSDIYRDANFRIINDADTSKQLAFSLSGLTTGTTSTLTVPASGTIARTEDFAAPPSIGSTTANSGSFTTLAANNGILNASAPVLDLAQTWSNGTVAFKGLLINITNMASLPNDSAYAEFQTAGTMRYLFTQSGRLSVNGASGGEPNFRAKITTDTVYRFQVGLASNNEAQIEMGAGGASARDTFLNRDAAGVFAQRNGTNPQTFRLYNTYTDASNHERGFMRWSSNVLQIGTEKGGTGSARALEFQTDGTTRFSISDAGNVRVFGALRVGANFNVGSLVVQHGDGVEAFRCQYNGTFDFAGRLLQMGAGGTGGTIQIHTDGDNLMALRRGTTAQNLRIYNTVSGTNNVNFDRVNLRWASNEFIIDAEAGGSGTLRGIKIGSATSSLLGFYGVTPVDQPATVADPTGGGTIDAEARTAINAIIDRLQELGLIA